MTTFQALTLMIGFGSLMLTSVAVTVAIVNLNKKK